VKGADKELQAMQAVFAALSDLEKDGQIRVLSWVRERLNVGAPAERRVETIQHAGPISNSAPAGALGPAKQFMALRRPASGTERVAALAYYLTHARGLGEFGTKELSDLNKEAAQPAFSNISVFARDAARVQYLAPAGRGKKQITARGEALVEALPNREQVAEVLKKLPAAGRSASGRKKKD
jgi:hypothetical protein